ncbi:ABC transporter permease [Variovorax sp. WS11]|uniref:ABC transporter permease n=1 Tax=Variovorax sp. WS11 TaxID=1105204 RepID=UPI001EF3D236|nr:ABC transporter permease [Variovorax sp. WS11]
MEEGIKHDRLARRYRWLATALAVLVYAYLVMPSLIVIPISFSASGDMSFPPKAFSLALYREFFTTSTWMSPVLQSLKIASITCVVVVVAAVPAAYALVRFEFPGKRLVIMLMMSPVLVPVIVLALGMYLYFSRLSATGTTLGLVLGHSVYVIPFVVVTIAAGIRQIDPAIEFAATMMGASRTTLFFRVVLPQIVPSIVAGALFAFLISFDEVVISWFLSSAQTTTLPVRMYSSIQWGVSPVIAAVSTLLTALSFIVCLVSVALQPNARQGSATEASPSTHLQTVPA